jgi:ABC-type uncharacterized transport system substrate-binding protein
MKMKRMFHSTILAGIMLALSFSTAFSADKGKFSTNPKTNDGKKWRIGYFEGGEYIDYQKTLVATVKGLMDLGWIEKAALPAVQGEETKALWDWLASRAQTKYIEFVKDAHYSGGWKNDVGKEMARKIIDRLNTKKDIDLMMAMGTFAGKNIANCDHTTPTMVLSTSDPVAAKIINRCEDSGADNIHARVDPFRYERQIKIFHDIIGFQKLGVAYEDTEAGRSYAAIDNVEKVSQELGFEIVRCFARSDGVEKAVAEEGVKKCFRDLIARGVDAIYVTKHGGVNSNSIPELVEIVTSNRVPTFSQSGSQEVRYGFLLSISLAGFKYVGNFYAETMAKIFNGAMPRQLEQIFESPPKIAINLKTAVLIDYDPPVDVLGAADEIFQEIEKP